MDDAAVQPIIQAPQETSPSQLASVEALAHDPRAAAAPRALKPSDPMIVFAYSCLGREFQSLVARRPHGENLPAPEDIHQIRIATRRLRIALKLFRRMLPAKTAATFSDDFRWFAHALGDVRDLDVYAENFRTYMQSIPPDQLQNLGGYELHLRRARAEARGNLGALFAGDRYAALLASFGQFLDGAPTPGALRRWRSFRIRDGVKKYLKRSARRVLKLGRKIGPDSPAKRLHRLRIRAKRLRYELEFFRDVYPSLDRAAKATKRLQDMLGEHQDACTATSRLTDYACSLATRGTRREHAVPAALEHLLQSQEEKARDMRRAFAAEWEHFQRTIEHTRVVAV